ncbi:amidase [Opitutales bacterium ASA1]|uniref:amidase n=1 Tax=Congregicoccus parvus TaxID=3081749 RepID=UPI002B2A9C74|nr:amidase [Opitutales bacterium ASA1]
MTSHPHTFLVRRVSVVRMFGWICAVAAFVPTAGRALAIEEASIADLHAAFREGRLTVRQAVEQHLERIEAYDKQGPLLNSIVNLNPKALAEADRLDAEFARTGRLSGSLHGVTVLVKDCIDAAGMPMTGGFQGWKNYVPPTDAPLVARLRAAGAIILGKASLSEFTRGGGDNINSVLPGFARNPYHTAYATGGSSGGSGNSIAAGFATVAIGTDTGGSIRMPAAHNALAGLRPTVGLVSRTGIVPNNSIRDTAGPMTRTVDDLARVMDVIVGLDPADPATTRAVPHIPATYTASLDKKALVGARLAVLRQVFRPERTDPRIIDNFEKTIAELRAAGAVVVDDFRVPELDTLPRAPQTSARRKADMIAFLAAHPGIPYPSPREIADSRLAHPLHQAGLEADAAAGPVETDKATLDGLATEEAYRVAFTKAMDAARIDALIFPTWAQLPAINGDRNTQITDDPRPAPDAAPTALGSSLTFVASTMQWPGLSVPNGYAGPGLPLGLQIVGRAWDDARVIGYAYAYEQATRYRRPPPSTPPLGPVTHPR